MLKIISSSIGEQHIRIDKKTRQTTTQTGSVCVNLVLEKNQGTQVETYGTSTVVFVPYFAVIQAGELRPYF